MMYAVAEPTPAMHAKITPSAAKPRVCRKKPTAIKIAKKQLGSDYGQPIIGAQDYQ